MKKVNLVDLFSGCGGLSLGFELYSKSTRFRTIMALDNHPAAVACFNHNHRRLRPKCASDVARVTDLTWFNNETEILLYYLNHYAAVTGDVELRHELNSLGFDKFLYTLWSLDQEYLSQVRSLRGSAEFKGAVRKLERAVSTLAIVKRFFRCLELPSGWTQKTKLPHIIWSSDVQFDIDYDTKDATSDITSEPDIEAALRQLWQSEIDHIRNANESSGRGQHSTVASKVETLVQLLESSAGEQLHDIWLHWRSRRDTVRERLCEFISVQNGVKSLYENGRRVGVLLGGPPCKGISRIGRAKIASLRDQGVHGWINREYGDDRNLLFLKYVGFVSAFQPDVFLFENVRHFTSALKTDHAAFDAAKSLRDAIDTVSNDEIMYECASTILYAHKHGCPQVRDRFFMLGLKRSSPDMPSDVSARKLLTLKSHDRELPLLAAIIGLDDPTVFRFGRGQSATLADRCAGYRSPLVHLGKVAKDYSDWLSFIPATLAKNSNSTVDAHVYREVRNDDAQLVSLFGPGKRWMDYTVNKGETLELFRSLAGLNRRNGKKAKDASDKRTALLADIVSDQSLVLRLLMEDMSKKERDLFGDGDRHHLLNETYLKKGLNDHGDWFERLDPSRPCKTIVAHMARDTYSFFHPWEPRPLTLREAARVQTFPDWFEFGMLGMCNAYEIVGNAVPPLLSAQIAKQIANFVFRVEKSTVCSS